MLMSSFVLKIIGMISMLIDHIGFVFYDTLPLRIIGRLAFPIFAFQSVIGFEHTSNKKKHFLKLFLFGLISQIPFSLLYIITKQPMMINVMFTILLGLLSIYTFETFENKINGFIAVFLISIIGEALRVDYGLFGILTIFFFYYFKESKVKSCVAFSLLFILRFILYIIYVDTIDYLFILLATLAALIPICLYNNKEGRKSKYLFYVFYPLHMIILYLIYLFK